jgi:hypothetical protein
MGYTHYWRTYRDFTTAEWVIIKAEAARIVRLAKRLDIRLAGPLEEGKPEITNERIALNGVAGEGYESFVLTRKQRKKQEWETGPGVFDFCKTNRSPYDSVVVSLLYSASKVAGDAILPSSDGGNVFGPVIDEMFLAWEEKAQCRPYMEVNVEILENKLSGMLDSICKLVNIDFAGHGVSSTELHDLLISKFSSAAEEVEILKLLSSRYDAFCDIAESLGARIKKEYQTFKHLNELTLIETYASN